MTTREACELGAIEARRLIAAGELSPVEVVESCIGRIEAIDGAVNAMVTRSFERAREEAAAAERALGSPDLPPLHGLPLAVKDLQSTEGIVTTYGSAEYAENVPSEDAGIVARARAAGAIVIGKTNIPEMSIGANTVNRLFGATGNPFDVDRSCGGSSGGSAVALATEMAPLATGSDHGGSLRIPASYCGVVGFRASPGLVPHEARTITQTNYSLQGPMGRSVPDAALLLSAIARRDRRSRRDPMVYPYDSARFRDLEPVDVGSLRIGATADLGGVMVGGEIREVFEERMRRLAGMVGSVVEVDIDLTGASSIDWELRADVFATQYHRDIERYDEGFNPNIRRTYENALSTTVLDIAMARRRQMELYQQVDEVFDDVDVFICPGVSVPPFPWRDLYPREVDGEPVANYMAWLALSASLTVVGTPVVALPMGVDRGGLPFGVQVVGPMHSDHRLLSICAALEAAIADDPVMSRPRPDIEDLVGVTSACRTEGLAVAVEPS